MNDVTKKCLLNLCQRHSTVLVLDAYNLVFKYFFANKDLSVTTPDGKTFLTGQIFGFTRNILWLKEHFPDCGIVVCVDGYDASRREINPEYKAHREHEIDPANDIPVLKSILSPVNGVYWCYDPNYEADDAAASVIRTIKHLCNKFNIDKQVYMLSSDKDWWQLIDDGVGKHCKIATVKKWGAGEKWLEDAQIITESKVAEEFNGTTPENLLKFRAITGDSSDNIKGYYRFYKKNAAIIAENFDYDVNNKTLTLKEGVEMRETWKKFLPTVMDNMETFSNNYSIMSLKDFDFELIHISEGVTEQVIEAVVKALETLKLYYYMSNFGKYSPYKELIDKYIASETNMIEESAEEDEMVKSDISSLL